MQKRLAYSYLRFSSPEQAKGDSVRRQMQKAADYAAAQGWELNTDLRDEGVSAYTGANLKGAFGGFLREIEAGRVPRGSILIVESLDRLSRAHPLDAQAQFHVLLKAGIEIVTLTDRRHYTWESVAAEPTLLLGSIMVMMRAHEESVTKAGRISDAWANKRAKLATSRDKPFTLKAPHWLKWNTATKKWDLVPERVAVLRRIFEMTADQGMGMAKVASILNAEGVPTFTGRTLSPGVTPGWQPATIGKILTARNVLGEFQPRRQVGPRKFKADSKTDVLTDYYPRVIGFDLWNRTQAVRAQNNRTGSGRKDGRVGNLFRGKVFCAACGSVTRTRYGKPLPNGTSYNYFICAANHRSAGTCTCKVWWDIDLIEQGVLAGIKYRQTFWETQAVENEQVKLLRKQIVGLADEHARKLRRFEMLGEMLADEESTSIRLAYRELSRELDTWDTRKAELEHQLAVARGTGTTGEIIAEAEALEALAKAADLPTRLTARNKLLVLMGNIIGRIELHDDRRAHVTLADGSLRFDVVKGEVQNVAHSVNGTWWHTMEDGQQAAE
ncbi:recombinase family protein [Teichococcus vastitatis]|uniref:recombinase family protein n=1 Tax=Teichococcus vastitatis TaxID=2307076 RepID=UPI000E73DB55|nr:recombinase family protein [Pseudoroseomonas vastitatis]